METASQTISNGLDFDQLRAEGIRLIQRLSSGRWTDFNTHDPGMTLLDVLCYTLTDLAYRGNWSIPDLVGEKGLQQLQKNYGIEKALPSAPITLIDLRKRLLDVPGVLNAHIEPVRSKPGFYYNPYDQGISTLRMEGIEESSIQGFYRISIAGSSNVQDILNKYRPLCCDWEFKELSSEALKLVVFLEISKDVSLPQQLALVIKEKIYQYLTPSVNFTTYADELRKGTPTDRVYEGPLLKQGFLRDSELDKLANRDYLRVSDLIQVLMDIPGIVAVKDIYFEDKGKQSRWLQPITADKYPLLEKDSEIYLDRGNQRTLVKVGALQRPSVLLPSKELLSNENGKQAETIKRNIGTYHSIRHHIPAIYGLHEDNLADMSVPARQLAGYLIFFEQLLADAFAQLSQAGQLFDFDNTVKASNAVQILSHISDFMTLSSTDAAEKLQGIADGQANDRFNRLLDHLMSRFAENFADYSLLMYDKPVELIADKRAFIKALPDFGIHRGLGFNYTDAESRSGLENRLALLLGMNLPLSGSVENFYLIEHILLRPVEQDTPDDDNSDNLLISDVSQADPYSRTMTFVFPSDFSNAKDPTDLTKWQNLVAQMARRETPAHLQINILWLTTAEFALFSTAYMAWRKALANTEGVNNPAYRVARDRVVDLLMTKENNKDKFLIGWHLPILDLEVEVPFVAANADNIPIVILNSQAGVEYTLLDYKGKSLTPPAKTVQGTGGNLPILLPKLTEDTTFRILASKKKIILIGRVKDIKETKGLLFQKIRVRVGTDVNIPVTVQRNEIRYGMQAAITLQRSQAQVAYRLLDANKSVVSPDFMGNQDQPLLLTSIVLKEDVSISIEAERSSKKTPFIGQYPIKVLPNQDLKLSAKTIVVDYGKTATIEIADAQVGTSYALVAYKILQNFFIHAENPNIWDAATLNAALPNSAIWRFIAITNRNDRYEDIKPLEDVIFGLKEKPSPGFTMTGEALIAQASVVPQIITSTLTADTYLLTTAKKQNHTRGVLQVQLVPVLVMPNLAVVATPSATTVNARETVTIQIADPQPYVLYTLVVKGTTAVLSSAMYLPRPEIDNDPIGLDALRIGFDFVIGGETDGKPVILQTPPLVAKTEFDIIAEKVRTGLNGKLSTSIVIDVTPITEPVIPRDIMDTEPKKSKKPRKPKE